MNEMEEKDEVRMNGDSTKDRNTEEDFFKKLTSKIEKF